MWAQIRALPAGEQWILALVCLVCVVVTAFPVAYGLTAPWHRSVFGRIMFAHSLTYAFAVDLTLFLSLADFAGIHLTYTELLWVQGIVWGSIGIAEFFLIAWLISVQYYERSGKRQSRP